MIYKAVEVIWIFLAGQTEGRDRRDIEGSVRGPRGPKKGQVCLQETTGEAHSCFWS